MTKTHRIVRNAAKCKTCQQVIESRYRHDFVTCRCGAVSVDGGRDYLKRSGDPGSYWDLSRYEPVIQNRISFIKCQTEEHDTMKQITSTNLRNRLKEVLEEVRTTGQPILITHYRKAVAVLQAPPAQQVETELEALSEIETDLIEEDEDFEEEEKSNG